MNKIIQGDCLEVMKDIPDKSIDLVITSPPYNVRNCVGGFFKQEKVRHIWRDAKLREGYDNYSDDMPYEDYIKWQRNVLRECMRILKEDGAIFYNHKFRIQNHLLLTRMEIIKDFPLRQIIIWNKGQAINYNYSHIPPSYEVIFLIAKKGFRFNSKGGWTDVWNIPPERNNKHPEPFPLEIPKKIIEKTNAKIILDPFMGSGTTGVACANLDRDFIGIEISEKYCKEAEKRINKVKEQQHLTMAYINFKNYDIEFDKFENDDCRLDKKEMYITFDVPSYDNKYGVLTSTRAVSKIKLNTNQIRCIRNENKIPITWYLRFVREQEWISDAFNEYQYIVSDKIPIRVEYFNVWRIAEKPNLTEEQRKERTKQRLKEKNEKLKKAFEAMVKKQSNYAAAMVEPYKLFEPQDIAMKIISDFNNATNDEDMKEIQEFIKSLKDAGIWEGKDIKKYMKDFLTNVNLED